MKVWSTKYALTHGIEEVRVQQSTSYPDMVEVEPLGRCEYLHGEGRDWHRSFQSAMKRANEMRGSKITALKKQIERLEGMDFNHGVQR